jgi:hypothetical protein
VSEAIRVEIAPLRFEHVEADLALAGFFEDERPLRGAAGRADWRLCGLISSLLQQGRLRGAWGEALLVPCAARLRVRRLLLLGLGERSGFHAARLRSAVRDATQRALLLRAESLALAAPGIAPAEVAAHAEPMLGAVAEALVESGLPPEAWPQRLRLVVEAEERHRTARAVEDALARLGAAPLRLERDPALERRDPPQGSEPAGRSRARSGDTAPGPGHGL